MESVLESLDINVRGLGKIACVFVFIYFVCCAALDVVFFFIFGTALLSVGL